MSIEIQKDCIISAITSMLNVRLTDSLVLMRNLDNRVLAGRTLLEQNCSFQVVNAYQMYRKYVELIDPEQHEKRMNYLQTA